MFVGHLYVFFGEMCVFKFSVLKSRLLVFSLLSCRSSFYILDSNPLSGINRVFKTAKQEDGEKCSQPGARKP